MVLNITDLMEALTGEEFKDLRGELKVNCDQPYNEGFFIKTVETYNEVHACTTYAYYYDLSKAKVSDILQLLNEMDYTVVKLSPADILNDEQLLAQFKTDEGDEEDLYESVGIYRLKDEQGGDLGTICEEFHVQPALSEASLLDTMVGLVNRLESHWEDYGLHFI